AARAFEARVAHDATLHREIDMQPIAAEPVEALRLPQTRHLRPEPPEVARAPRVLQDHFLIQVAQVFGHRRHLGSSAFAFTAVTSNSAFAFTAVTPAFRWTSAPRRPAHRLPPACCTDRKTRVPWPGRRSGP